MGGQDGGENQTPEGLDARAQQEELADLVTRFGQMAKGQRTEFEKALLAELAPMMSKEVYPWAFDSSPLTAAHARALAVLIRNMNEAFRRATGLLNLYNDMRGAMGEMLQRLPALPDSRFEKPDPNREALPSLLKKYVK